MIDLNVLSFVNIYCDTQTQSASAGPTRSQWFSLISLSLLSAAVPGGGDGEPEPRGPGGRRRRGPRHGETGRYLLLRDRLQRPAAPVGPTGPEAQQAGGQEVQEVPARSQKLQRWLFIAAAERRDLGGRRGGVGRKGNETTTLSDSLRFHVECGGGFQDGA